MESALTGNLSETSINMSDKYKKISRAEMKGPSDLDDILSGLKTKKINIQQKGDTTSVVSVSELAEMKKGFEKFKPYESKEDNRLKFALDVTNKNNYSVQVLFQTDFGTMNNKIYRIIFGVKKNERYF